jgi:carbon starvation protein
VLIFKSDRKKYFFVTAIPLVFILITVSWAVLEKVFSADVRIGFFALANSLQTQLENSLILGAENIEIARKTIFNQRLVGVIALSFAAILWIVVIDGIRSCISFKRK